MVYIVTVEFTNSRRIMYNNAPDADRFSNTAHPETGT